MCPRGQIVCFRLREYRFDSLSNKTKFLPESALELRRKMDISNSSIQLIWEKHQL